ncbi:MAG TPA: tRNA glutamyl-Q(34) synthetase GluQRS [Thiolapillus brandeum]|uniref:Glutamyl-Q tRNA(Asp) synthetase n=1 Tax=Thiolapillus brandeum TaxID=1076588 RepID=A0A831K495_9GAMM|nr:tRNA glutamyl-Q(34) synthetase GluQRS [Thiolapillus brandeum]
MSSNSIYRGRFAPSPTGSLHFGSLVAAVAGYADALHHQGNWLVRMEDVDENRVVKGSADDILHTLETLGFEWDGEIIFQSQCKSRYREILEWLQQQKLVYACSCSRREIAAQAEIGIEGPVYPGTCRQRITGNPAGKALRLLTDTEEIHFRDRIQGEHRQVLAKDVGDFIVHRADGYTAYQLAVVVDDAYQGINQVVRGADLLLSTPRQIYLQKLLNFPHPAYAHVPLVTDNQGRKLSKQDQAHPVSAVKPVSSLKSAWDFLQQTPTPKELDAVEDFWKWAASNWSVDKINSWSQ